MTKTSREKLSVKIDYISIVFDTTTARNVITKLFNLKLSFFNIQNAGIKYKSYQQLYQMGNIRIYGDCKPTEENPNGLGCYLVLGGQGCDQLQGYLKAQRKTYQDFFKECSLYYSNTFHLTRLDIAIDDKNEVPYFTVEQIKKKCIKEEFLSKSRTYSFTESSLEGDSTAKTVYIGRKKSNVFYRFYDKEKEQIQKGFLSSESAQSWKRTELVLRDEMAHAFAMHMKEDSRELGQLVFDYTSTSLRFISEDKNQMNKSRWKTSRFWERFLGATKPLKLSTEKEINSLCDTQEWIRTGGVLPAVVVFEFLNENQALGDLYSLGEMKQEVRFSSELVSKVVSHLTRIQREDLIPKLYEKTIQNQIKR